MDHTDDDLPQGYDEVLAVLRAPVEVDQEVRARHLAESLGAEPRRATVTPLRRRLVPLLAAAALLLLIGVVGTWGLIRPGTDEVSTATVAAGRASTTIDHAARSDKVTEAGSDEATQQPSPGLSAPLAAERSDQAPIPSLDLGEFGDDAALRTAAEAHLATTADSGVGTPTTVVPDTPSAPGTAPPRCALPAGISWVATATVGGTPVLVGRDTAGEVVVVDRSTCAPR